MPRIDITAFGLAFAVLTGCSSSNQRDLGADARAIQGTWEVISALRDDESDPVTAGARLTFARDQVIFLPKFIPKEAQIPPEAYLS
jgi:hypothetical protein